MITFTHERMDSLLMDEMESLWKIHWEEVANYQDKMKLNVDRELYTQMQDSGLYQTITARNEEGALIGYIGFLITTHPHYKESIFANMDNVFLHKDYRKGFVGIKLFQRAEKLLKELGVDIIMMRSKHKSDLSPIFKLMNYSLTETVYSKYIGEDDGS